MRTAEAVASKRRRDQLHRTVLGLGFGLGGFVALQTLAEPPAGQGGGLVVLAGPAVGYLSLAVPTALIAARGTPRLAVLLPLSYFTVPFIVRVLGDGDFRIDSYLPGMPSYEPLQQWPWIRAAVYSALLMAPALATPKSARQAPRKLDLATVSGLVICGSAVLVLLYVSTVLSRGPLDMGVTAATIAGALLLTFQRKATVSLRLLLGLMTSGAVIQAIGFARSGWTYLDWNVAGRTMILALIPVVLGFSPGVGSLSIRAVRRPLVLLALVNIFNVADALLTLLGERGGALVETNPFVAQLGLLPKIVAVALASWLIYRLRPRWLLTPAVLLACVLIYHVGGLVL
jgi:hypothetical protein